MLRKFIPIIICVVVLIAATLACTAVKSAWSAEEHAVFNANVDDKIAADLAQSAIVDSVGSADKDMVVPDESVYADGKSVIGDALSGKSRKESVFDDMDKWVPSGEGASANISLAGCDGTTYAYLVKTTDKDGKRHVALYGYDGASWTRYASFDVK